MPKLADNSEAAKRSSVQVDLALQGGGSHGAFTWGVLDRLLEEPWLKIEAISGTSAGAMNAAVLVSGYMAGRRRGREEGAQPLLGQSGRSRAVQSAAALAARQDDESLEPRHISRLSRNGPDVAHGFALQPQSLSAITRSASILEKSIDFAHLDEATIKLFITATNVHTGRGRVFRNKDITPDVLLASACLPTMFQAIEIEGEPYWDGGFVGNPTITPLVRESEAADVILVQINPRVREETPRTATEILNRLNEISFNSPLMKELRMIALLRQAVDPGTGEGARWARMRTHWISHRQTRRIWRLVETQR